MSARAAVLGLSLALAAAAALDLRASAVAHEEGVIRLAAKSVAIGDTLEIRGERLPKSDEVRLELRGALASHPLMAVQTDSAGVFVAQVPIPGEASPGLYRVVAIASDGDDVARAELVVVAAAPADLGPANAVPAHSVHPTDARMAIPVERSAGAWAVIATFVLACALGGAVLLRKVSRSDGAG